MPRIYSQRHLAQSTSSLEKIPLSFESWLSGPTLPGAPRHSLGWAWRPSIHPHHALSSLFKKINLFLAPLCDMQDLSSLTRDQTCGLCSGSV